MKVAKSIKMEELRIARGLLDVSMTAIYKTSKNKGRSYYKRAKKHRVKNHLDTYTILRLFNASRWSCVYCGRLLVIAPNLPATATLDHIVPMCRGGANLVNNVVPCCDDCNDSKNDLAMLNWLEQRQLDLEYFAFRYRQLWINLQT